MGVRPGYKQTEAGIIPEDWCAVPLKSITPPNRKNTIVDGPFGSNLKSIHYRKFGIPIITSGFVTDGRFHAETYDYVDRSKFLDERRSAVNPGDIVMAKIGERCGASAILPHNHETGILSGNALKITVDESQYSTTFVWQVLWNMHESGQLECLRTVGAQPALSMANLKKHKIPVPPTKDEQRAIAAALSDVDALLGGLDRLIAKKRDLKTAAMQQLLTDEARLPGFGGEWEVRRLGDAATFYKGKGLPKTALSPYGSEPCVHYGELFTHYSETIRETISRTNKKPDEFRSVANDVLMPTSDVTPRGLAKASCVVVDDVVLGGDILVIRADPAVISGTFLSHVIRREEDQVLRLVTGTTVFHLYGSDMKKFTFKHPELEEQQAIVGVLSEMDAELRALEARRDKTRDIKQAMMQELLTGKTRLVPAGVVHA